MIKYPLGARLLLFGLSLPLPGLLVTAAITTGELPGLETLMVPAIVIILLIMLNGIFVVAEFAIIGVRASQMEQLAHEGQRLAANVLGILRSTDSQNRYIATAQLGITMASLGLGMYGESQISHFLEPYLGRLLGLDVHEAVITTLGYLIAVSLLTYLHIVGGEMVPKSLALAAPNRAVFAVFQPMRLMQTIFSLPVRLLNGIGNALLYLFRIPPTEGQARLHSTVELELLVSESVEGGLLTTNEEEIIRNIFDFRERQVNQVMTPRPRVEAVPHDISLADLLEQMAESRHSRLPVYEQNLDHIIGILHVKDLVRYQAHSRGTFDIRLVLRPVPVVPENYPVEKLLTMFKRQRVHIAIVLDEFGGTAGIVTLEDLVEEVVGEVRDEFDLENEPLVQLAPGVLEVAGDFLIEDLEDYLDLSSVRDVPGVETIGGLIMTELGRLPQVEDKVILPNNIHITVLAIDGLAVARARIEYPPPPVFTS
ncbi:MAG: HlyC/CorC family transporter [Anaerolineae bacterium]|nr:HlyC/CorC family transporter [Anaerolineae bacterium]